jgi:hypothetical protein
MTVAAICRGRFAQMMTLEQQAAVAVVVPHLIKVAEQDADALADDDLCWPFTGLARLSENQADFSGARAWYERCLQHCEERLGPDHPDTAASLNNLAGLLKAINRLVEAEPLMRRHLLIFLACSKQGFEHPHLQAAFGNYISLLQAMGLPEAEIQAKLHSLQPPT